MEMEIEIVSTLNLLSLCKILLLVVGKIQLLRVIITVLKGDVFPPNHLGHPFVFFKPGVSVTLEC